jgi:hypothetical protein
MADLRRSIDVMLKSAEGIGYNRPQTLRQTQDDYADPSALYTNGELSRQLRTCMREIVELRSELAAEREGRSQLLQLHSKRIKEELFVEIRTAQHTVLHDYREFEAHMRQRSHDLEAAAANDRRKIEEALRFTKLHERSQFDAKEELREGLDELRGRVDAAVALCTGTRTEAVQDLERERAALQHRLDVELMRYGELYRKQQHDLEEAKRGMAREVERVSLTIGQLVDAAWHERFRGLSKTVNDSLTEYQEAHDRISKLAIETQREVVSVSKSVTRDTAVLQATIAERLGTIEATLPTTLSRVERFEKRVDAAVESNAKISAVVDVLREGVDKAVAHSQRACERAQKTEDTTADRDSRISAIEAQCIVFSGMESYRLELEATKRGLVRIDHSIDAAVKASIRAEKIAEDTQRAVDAAIERTDASEKRGAKIVSRVEVAEQRVSSFTDRLVVLEDGTDRIMNSLSALEQQREGSTSKLTSLDSRLSSLAERSETAVRELRERISDVESRVDIASDSTAKAVEAASQATKECERTTKRLVKTETSMFNFAENTSATKASLDQTTRILETLTSRHDSLERMSLNNQSIINQATESQREFSRQLAALQDRVTTVQNQSNTASRDASLALTRVSTVANAAPVQVQAPLHDAELRLDLQRVDSLVQKHIIATGDIRTDVDILKEQTSALANKFVTVTRDIWLNVDNLKHQVAVLGDAPPHQRSESRRTDLDVAAISSQQHSPFVGNVALEHVGTSLPPLGPAAGVRAAAPKLPMRPSQNPYQTDDSDRSASVVDPQRRRADMTPTDGSSPTGETEEAQPPAAASAQRPRFYTSSEASTPDHNLSLSRARPTTENPFKDSSAESSASATPQRQDDEQRRKLQASLLSNNPFTPQESTARVAETPGNDWDESDEENDKRASQAPLPAAPQPARGAVEEGVSPPSSRAAPQAAGQRDHPSPISSKATDDVSLSLTASTLPGRSTGAASAPKVVAQSTSEPQKKPSAWDFDADEEDEVEELDDDDLANMV